MRVLRAPNDHTLDRVTSVGMVHFENGIATEFTPEQAQFFCERQRGYELEIIDDEVPATNAKIAEEKTKETVEAAPIQQEDLEQPKTSTTSTEDGEGGIEEKGKSAETSEASQDGSDGAQAAPAATSADEGTGGQAEEGGGKIEANDGEDHGEGEGTGNEIIPPETTEKIKLPTSHDSRRVVARWCRNHDVDDTGTKAILLERIYADDRFKK